jgi:hypothetical protein
MFVERKVCDLAWFTYLVGWHASAVSVPPNDVTLAKLACLLSDVMFCLHSGITNLYLSTNIDAAKNEINGMAHLTKS